MIYLLYLCGLLILPGLFYWLNYKLTGLIVPRAGYLIFTTVFTACWGIEFFLLLLSMNAGLLGADMVLAGGYLRLSLYMYGYVWVLFAFVLFASMAWIRYKIHRMNAV